MLGKSRPETQMPPWVFFVQLVWVLLLIAMFAVFETSASLRRELPHSFGHIPFEVWWFGAFGGCLVSFGGIVQYSHRWEPRFNYWHPVKPLLGAATGGVGCVLLLATLRAASPTLRTTDPTLFDGAAFVFGYAESSFRQLVKALSDTLLKPGGAAASSVGRGARPTAPAAPVDASPAHMAPPVEEPAKAGTDGANSES